MTMKKCLIFVHLYDTNRLIVKEAAGRKIPVVLLSTPLLLEESRGQLAACMASGKFDAEIIYDGDLQGLNTSAVKMAYESVTALPWNVLEFVPGSDNSVELCFRLRNIRDRGTDDLLPEQKACLDKYLMNELIHSKNLASVKQRCCSRRSEIQKMIEEDSVIDLPLVVKPIFSTASEDVFLCNSVEEACDAMEHITKKEFTAIRLPQHKVALCQELLIGEEYVVDTVSRDGKHKIVSVWKYEKKPCNGSQFVYFAMRLMPKLGVVVELCSYVENVLNSLDFMVGACHTEVILTSTGPILVEVNCRVGGFMESWVNLASVSTGINPIEAIVNAYVSNEKFAAIKEYPSVLKQSAINVLLPSFEKGKILAVPGLEEVKKLSTYTGSILLETVGDEINKTTNLFENTGYVMLAGKNQAELDQQCHTIHKMLQEQKFFLSERAI